ncbi:uncharacterized protein SAPINGB_P001607 [Magnusiomyces paraingens]|uniref:Ribosomal protein S11 n=1 Tax=Magnusiomyces paraingens TaxID=2606893 RepID=A0A5E8B6L5_9ASCO|nr:uncharacterized protein SAPINGB_P001607 [Saprochaete ingens]VVT47229.1 unnamed protein product [Saprochaete ingens]
MFSLRPLAARQTASLSLSSRVLARFASGPVGTPPFSLSSSSSNKTSNIFETAKSLEKNKPSSFSNTRNPSLRTSNKYGNSAPAPPPEPEDGKQRVGYVLHCKFTPNNTILTLTSQYVRVGKRYVKLTKEERYMDLVRPLEDVRINLTAGILGFRHTKQGEYEAGFQTAARMFALMSEREFLDHPLEIILSNFGKGREAFLNALNGAEGNLVRPLVTRVTDGTKIRIGGVRPPRARRV